jgi:transposase
MAIVANPNRDGKREQSKREDRQWTPSADERVHVGLDVHKKSIHVAIWSIRQERIVRQWVTPADYGRLVEPLELLRSSLVRIVYEAGPTGYRLARLLAAAGLPVDVIAASKTPQIADRTAKSDGLDCRQLAEFSAKRLLHRVAIPTEQQEADRQVTRLRDAWTSKRRRVQQQIKSFLLQHGLAEPAGLTNWSSKGIDGLKQIALGPELRFALDLLVEELVALNGQLVRIRKEIVRLSKTERHGPSVAVLTSHPGVGLTVAMAFCTELHQASQFRDAAQVGQYVGLAPRVSQSGQTRRDGPICRTGRGPLRALLVQAAWMWTRYDPAARAVFARLTGNTGSSQKAIVGMARRLAIRLWKMMVTGETYRVAA